MPLFDIFKKKHKAVEPQLKEELLNKGETLTKVARVSPLQKESIKDPAGIILKPHVSEKASQFQENNEYVFEVLTWATKLMVRDALERTYGVNASKVRIINVKPRKVRVGRFQGTKPGFKKAIVKLKIGQKIDSLSA